MGHCGQAGRGTGTGGGREEQKTGEGGRGAPAAGHPGAAVHPPLYPADANHYHQPIYNIDADIGDLIPPQPPHAVPPAPPPPAYTATPRTTPPPRCESRGRSRHR